MLVIPIELKDGGYDLMIVLEADNLSRMRENDPAIVELDKLVGPWQGRELREIHIVAPTAEDLVKAITMAKERKLIAALKFLERGWLFRPEQGDHNQPYQIITGKREH